MMIDSFYVIEGEEGGCWSWVIFQILVGSVMGNVMRVVIVFDFLNVCEFCFFLQYCLLLFYDVIRKKCEKYFQ